MKTPKDEWTNRIREHERLRQKWERLARELARQERQSRWLSRHNPSRTQRVEALERDVSHWRDMPPERLAMIEQGRGGASPEALRVAALLSEKQRWRDMPPDALARVEHSGLALPDEALRVAEYVPSLSPEALARSAGRAVMPETITAEQAAKIRQDALRKAIEEIALMKTYERGWYFPQPLGYGAEPDAKLATLFQALLRGIDEGLGIVHETIQPARTTKSGHSPKPPKR